MSTVNKQGSHGMVVLVAALGLTVACEQTLRTGKVGNKTNAPNPDGTCPSGLTACGKDAFARCLDLQNDREHCGACDNACVAGIACVMGTCQQVACTASVTVSNQTLPETIGESGAGPQGVLLADVNCDGRPDLVNWDGMGKLQVALGEPGGGFGAPSSYETGTMTRLTVVDWNSDGCDDLYAEHMDGVVWMGHPDGKLTLTTVRRDNSAASEPMFADLNGDGIMDMVATVAEVPLVFLADATGAFHDGTPLSDKPIVVLWRVRDWNGDGFPDVLTTRPMWDGLSVHLNKGNGTFEDGIECGVYAGWSTVVADLDHDGHMDLAYGLPGRGVEVLMGMGGCQFRPITEYPLTGTVYSLAYADLDGDGVSDLVAATDDGSVYLLHGAGDGTFQVTLLRSGPACGAACWLLVGDVTGDGKPDLVTAGLDTSMIPHSVQLVENTCP
jgi:hypothetical protein